MTLPSNLYDSLCQSIEKIMACLEQEKQIITKFDFASISSILATKREALDNYNTLFTSFVGEKESKLLAKDKKTGLMLLIKDLQEKMIENQEILDKGIKLNQKMMQLFLKITRQAQLYTSSGISNRSKSPIKAMAIDERF